MKNNRLLSPPTKQSEKEIEFGLQTKLKRSCSVFVRCFLMIVMLWCFAMALINSENINQDKVDLVKKEGSWSYDELEQIREVEEQKENPESFAAWGEKKGEYVENKSLNRIATVSVLELWGDSDFIDEACLPVLKKEDKEGCLIDRETSYLLFGTEKGTGNSLQYGDRNFLVRGILNQSEHVVMIQKERKAVSSGGEDGMNHIVLQISDGKDKKESTEAFMRSHGIEGQVLKMDWIYYTAFCFAMGMPFILALILMKKIFLFFREVGTEKKKDSQKNIRDVLGLCFLFGMVIIIFSKLTEIHVALPSGLIPARWSDFSFWEDFRKSWMESYQLLISASKNPVQVGAIRQCLKSVKMGILSALLLILLKYEQNIKK